MIKACRYDRLSPSNPSPTHQFIVFELRGKLQRTIEIDHGRAQRCSGGTEWRSAIVAGSGPDRLIQRLLEGDSALLHPSPNERSGVGIERDGRTHSKHHSINSADVMMLRP
jgi:hypothetical protein